MNKYFFLSEKIKKGTAFAFTKDMGLLSHELISKVKNEVKLPFELTLKSVMNNEEGLMVFKKKPDTKQLWLDYLPNNLAWPLMSQRMKDIISTNLTGNESIMWIKANIKAENEERDYFIPCFKKELDVLDLQKTVFVPNTNYVLKPVFSLPKVSRYSMFYKPQQFWEITSALYINENLKNLFKNKKLTGLDFEEVLVL